MPGLSGLPSIRILPLVWTQFRKLASADSIKRMETRAAAAEQLVFLLKKQIGEIKAVAQITPSYADEIELLKKENTNLKVQIGEWKEKLILVEGEHDVSQIRTGGETIKSETVPTKTAPGKKEKNSKKPDEDLPVHVGRLDMRVGLIRSAVLHPDAETLYVEEVDVGEDKPRTVISGLKRFIPLEEMQNRRAIIMCNLKPSKMRGILSEAMVMCASTPEAVEILSPPADAKPGDPVLVAGFDRIPDAQLNPKKKVFEACAPDLRVDSISDFHEPPWIDQQPLRPVI